MLEEDHKAEEVSKFHKVAGKAHKKVKFSWVGAAFVVYIVGIVCAVAFAPKNRVLEEINAICRGEQYIYCPESQYDARIYLSAESGEDVVLHTFPSDQKIKNNTQPTTLNFVFETDVQANHYFGEDFYLVEGSHVEVRATVGETFVADAYNGLYVLKDYDNFERVKAGHQFDFVHFVSEPPFVLDFAAKEDAMYYVLFLSRQDHSLSINVTATFMQYTTDEILASCTLADCEASSDGRCTLKIDKGGICAMAYLSGEKHMCQDIELGVEVNHKPYWIPLGLVIGFVGAAFIGGIVWKFYSAKMSKELEAADRQSLLANEETIIAKVDETPAPAPANEEGLIN